MLGRNISVEMLSNKHPITGKEVRIIQTGASLWREHKTLFYGSGKSVWDTVSETGTPKYRLMLEPVDMEDLSKASLASDILVISKDTLKNIDRKQLRVRNVLYLNEIHMIYPHLGAAWDGTVEDAVVLLAGLLRYRRLVGISSTGRSSYLKIGTSLEKPMRLWWITQYYKPENARRQRELQKCLKINTDSVLIDKIILMNEKKEVFAKSDKIQEVVIGKRLTYEDVFNKIMDIPDDVIVAFANADICIDDSSWRDLWNLNLEDKFLALLRYDVPSSDNISDAVLFGPRADSQDAWIIRAADVKQRGGSEWKDLNFNFGRMGCDNAIAYELMRQKFLVVNPAQTIKTWHFHSSDVRNYSKTDLVLKHVFHYIAPSAINDLTPVFKFENTPIIPAAMKRILRGSGTNDWLKVSKSSYKPELENLVVPDADAILELNDCFQTCDGLVFDRSKMYVGESVKGRKAWADANVHSMMPTIDSEKMFIIPWPHDGDKSREIYCIRYLSKVLRLYDLYGAGDFFGYDNYQGLLGMFQWNIDVLPVISREEDMLVWAKKGYGFPLTDSEFVLKEDVDALRKFVKSWRRESSADERKMVIVQDNVILKAGLVSEIEEKLESSGWEVVVLQSGKSSLDRIVGGMVGSSAVICSGSIASFGWNWLLPVGAAVFELNAINSDGLHLSSAAGLEHRFLNIIGDSLSKGNPLEKQIKTIMEEVESLASQYISVLTTIWMPRSSLQGYFSHPGDSFREMVRLWKKAGYVNIKEHPTATMVWWGEVGEAGVLLYDRPIHDWRMAAPIAEKTWRKALFGNPKVGACADAVPWFFWPRRPELVEELCSASTGLPAYDSRSDGMVFYGRIENMVQASRRKDDWKAACAEWFLIKEEGQPYPFTQKEYLERLAKWRFGLCLSGYGRKCHREIECMAMGCVPVVAPDVDMDSYANPLVEGTHYLRVKTPEDAIKVLKSVSKDDWERMHLAGRTWWEKNASCRGSFELTRSLVE